MGSVQLVSGGEQVCHPFGRFLLAVEVPSQDGVGSSSADIGLSCDLPDSGSSVMLNHLIHLGNFLHSSLFDSSRVWCISHSVVSIAEMSPPPMHCWLGKHPLSMHMLQPVQGLHLRQSILHTKPDFRALLQPQSLHVEVVPSDKMIERSARTAQTWQNNPLAN